MHSSFPLLKHHNTKWGVPETNSIDIAQTKEKQGQSIRF